MNTSKPRNSFIITQYHVSVGLPSRSSSPTITHFCICDYAATVFPYPCKINLTILSNLFIVPNLEQLLKLQHSKMLKLVLLSQLRKLSQKTEEYKIIISTDQDSDNYSIILLFYHSIMNTFATCYKKSSHTLSLIQYLRNPKNWVFRLLQQVVL